MPVTSLFQFVRRPEPFLGHIDKIESDTVFGWAHFPRSPERRILVDIFIDGTFAGQRLANLRREDLRLAEKGDAKYAFELALPRGMVAKNSERVSAVALGETRRPLLPGFSSAPVGDVESKALLPRDYLRATFGKGFAHAPAEDVVTSSRQDQAEPSYERLLRSTPIPESPGGLGCSPCGYVDLVRHRSGRTHEFAPTLVRSDYARLLGWYLDVYGRRRGLLRAPLSAQDIDTLNGASPDGRSEAQTLFGQHFGALPNESAEQAELRWLAFDAAAFCIEDCLLPPQAITRAAMTVGGHARFPQSRLMAYIISINPYLSKLPLDTDEQRAFACFAFLLFAATEPHWLMCVPDESLTAFFDESSGSGSLFDGFSHDLFRGGQALTATQWREAVASKRFDIATKRFLTRTPSGGRIYSAAIAVNTAQPVDIQIIGPFSRVHGIGQSCRRLSRALSASGYRIRNCDFTLDHPNRQVRDDLLLLEKPGPAAINVLHLNLDDVPAAFAYLPDVFTGARNIAFPYTELSPLSPDYRVGLDLVEEVWAASRFIADVVLPYRSVTLVGTCFDERKTLGRDEARRLAYHDLGCRADDFIFLTSGDALSGVYRKNPAGAARAFLAAFPGNDQVRLVIKTHSIDRVATPFEEATWRAIRDLGEADPRIILADGLVDDARQAAFIEGCDVLLSLHRSEGFGYHILEAMAFGVPVVATGYSGNLEFCLPETSFIVPHRLIHLDARLYPRSNPEQVWADPDHDAAVAILRQVHADQHARETIARAGRDFVTANFSEQAFVKRLKERLAALL